MIQSICDVPCTNDSCLGVELGTQATAGPSIRVILQSEVCSFHADCGREIEVMENYYCKDDYDADRLKNHKMIPCRCISAE